MQKPMKIENDELPAQLVKATNAGGRTGDAAKAVANVAPGVEFMFDILTAELQLAIKRVGLRDKGRHAKAELPPIGYPISP